MPSTAWWKSNTVEDGERGHTLSHSSKKARLTHSRTSLPLHAFIHPFTCPLGDQGPLTDVRSVRDDQPLFPSFQTYKQKLAHTHTHVYSWNPQRALWVKRTTLSSPLPLLSFFAASSKRPGRWITTPLPGGINRSAHFKTKSMRLAAERAASTKYIEYSNVTRISLFPESN